MKVVNIGSLNIDYVYTVPHFVRPGETLYTTRVETFCGGKGLNQSVALTRAGLEVFHAGCVGEDGRLLEQYLAENGADIRFIRHCPGRTGHTIIQVDASGQNSILLFGGANRLMTEEYIDEVLAAFSAGDILLLQNEVNLVDSMIRKAKARGMRVAVNPAPMQKNMLTAPLNLADMLFLNELEAEELCGEREPERQLSALRARYPGAALVLTLGEEGALYQGSDGITHRQGIYRVPVADTTAAGDTFIAYLMAGLETNLDVPDSLRLAAKAAAITVSREGAAPSIPRMEEVRSFTGSESPAP